MEAPPRESAGRRLSSFLHRHPRLRLGLLLTPPLSWLLLAYLGSLAVLFVAAFWRLDPFTAEVVHDYGFQNFRQLWESDVYRAITQRTVLIAAAVTVTDAVLAFPIAFYMAKVASPRTRNLLVVAILLPLWASYLVKVYAWRIILQEQGILNWVLEPFGLSGPGFGNVATWLVFSYLWLPFMILPVYAGLERIPSSLLEASADLGAHGVPDALARRPPARPARGRGRLDLHLLADARRLHHAGSSSRARSSSATSSTSTSASRTTSHSRPRSRPCRSW